MSRKHFSLEKKTKNKEVIIATLTQGTIMFVYYKASSVSPDLPTAKRNNA